MTGATGATGPTGPTGASGAQAEFLSAYSTPPQSGTASTPLIFDRTASSNGTAVTHTDNTAPVTVQEPGFYEVSFHGTISPASGVSLPETIQLYLTQQGTTVPGADATHTFSAASDTASLSFSQIVQVTSVPAEFEVIPAGGDFLYSGTTMTVSKIGS